MCLVMEPMPKITQLVEVDEHGDELDSEWLEEETAETVTETISQRA